MRAPAKTPAARSPRRGPPAQSREEIATRLLRVSRDHSHDPLTEIDWDRALDPALYAMPPHRISLYGTALWEQLSEEERVRLSWHELASISSVGIWFELILMQMLLRWIYDENPHDPHVQYALTEIGDETRHSVMFARMSARLAPGCRYRPSGRTHQLARGFKTLGGGASMLASVLVAEEVLDRLQRELIRTEGMLPLASEVSRIHVVEESRHVSFARSALERQVPGLSRLERAHHQMLAAIVATHIVDALVDPEVYAAVGIDPAVGASAAGANPNWRETRRWSAEKITSFLREAGMVSLPSELVLRRAYLC